MATEFLDVVTDWFRETYGEPTYPQREGWQAISEGHHTLIVAPTGSGKTLAAFLWALDHLWRLGLEGRLEERVYLVYVSPLKALNNDIEKNLRIPLQGIRERAATGGPPLPEIRVAVRTGDTLAHARQAMTRRPPHVLITTPESLYILLTTEKFRPALRTVRFVIVDEVHALAASKRGAHLSLSLERLQQLAGEPIQRIGCSATVRPLDVTAHFLTGVGRPCRVVDAGFQRRLDLQVLAPVADFLTAQSDTVWETLLQELSEWILAHRTTLIFCPSRRMTERLARNLNDRLPDGQVASHHGSLSRRTRLEAEEKLKRGDLRALVATSSLELGMDIGSIDLVVQLQSPRNIAAALQRVGRSGHLLSRVARGRIVVTKGEELIEAAAVARAIREGELDQLRIPQQPLDVLAQQIVAAVAAEPWQTDDLFRLVKRSACYEQLGRDDFDAVVRSLATPLPAEVKGAAPRILWDQANGRLHARRGSRLLALTSGGTIADAGLYDVFVRDTDLKVGTLDEEFVSESLPGDVFLLGSHAWRLVRLQADRVLVEDAAGMSPTVPFWRGEHPSRSWELGRLVGRLRREATERLDDADFEEWIARECGCEPRAARALRAWLAKGREILGGVPDDRTLAVESFPDELGGRQLVLHSIFGMRVNGAWGLALKETLRRRFGLQPEVSHVDDGILLAFAPGQTPPPAERIPHLVTPEGLDGLLARALIGSPLFTTRFRHVAVRALFVPRMIRGSRTPAWLQRLKADALLEAVGGQPDFPLVAETIRECCHDALDVERLDTLLGEIRAGAIGVRSAETVLPSPFTYPLLLAWDWSYLDAGHAEERRSDAVSMLKAVPGAAGPLDAQVMKALEAELQSTAGGRRARDANELAALLEDLGDLDADEVALRVEGDSTALLEELRRDHRAAQIHLGNGRRPWISAPEEDLYAGKALDTIVLRFLRRRGPVPLEALATRYSCAPQELTPILEMLEGRGIIRSGTFLPDLAAPQYVHTAVLQEVQRRQIRARRRFQPQVSAEEFAAFLLRWQHVHPDHRVVGPDGLLKVIEPLQGEDSPVAFWEQEVFPARLEAYDPAWLDQLGLTGQLVWLPFEHGHPGRLGFALRENLPWLISPHASEPPLNDRAKAVLRQLQLRGALFVMDFTKSTGLESYEVVEALWELLWKGLVTTDTFQTVRLAAGAAKSQWASQVPVTRRPSRKEARRRVRERLSRPAPLLGRWSALAVDEPAAPDEREEAWGRHLLTRYGVVSRELARGTEWATLRRTLIRLEYAGEVLRGYFVRGLSGEQYALEEALEELQAGIQRREPPLLLNSCDPANLWGHALPLSRRDGSKPPVTRIPSTLLLVRGGSPRLLVEGYGRDLTPLAGFEIGELPELIRVLQDVLKRPPALRPVKRIDVHTWDGAPVRGSEAAGPLLKAGFYPDGPRLIWDGYPGPRPRG
ncbi:MAG: DEAD/DEAH box helicase [Candidatus Rokubacteria bacterium]|nr:DEAD/DEAH box helicase [Candidatus Rokubacteria bacterium]